MPCFARRFAMVHPRKVSEDEAPASAANDHTSPGELERYLSIAHELATGLEHSQAEDVEEVRLARALALNIVDLLESVKARRARPEGPNPAFSVAQASHRSNQR